MKGRKRRSRPLGLRLAWNVLLLALVLAAFPLMLYEYPFWKTEQHLRAGMRADGLSGQGEVLWRGVAARTVGGSSPLNPLSVLDGDGVVVIQEDGQLYACRLHQYEGMTMMLDSRGELPRGPGVAALDGCEFWMLNGTLGEVMVLNLPEGAKEGRLTVELLPDDIREVTARRDQGTMIFRLKEQWRGECLERDGSQYTEADALRDGEFTLVLLDESGAVLSQTCGPLADVWR